MDRLLELADRCEAATAEQTKELLREAFDALHGPYPPDEGEERDAWLVLGNPFYFLLDAGGFLDAAMSLVPEGWAFDLVQQLPPTRDTARVYGSNGQVTDLCYGRTPALALCAAALRALSTQQKDGGK